MNQTKQIFKHWKKRNLTYFLSVSLFLLFFVILGKSIVSNQNVIPDYTIMIYMNGSDLETEDAMATHNLEQILTASKSFNDNINVIIQTGGTQEWQEYDIPSDSLMRYQAKNGELKTIQKLPLASIGAPKTLKDFINFSIKNYPAKRYGLILWNHGGGSVMGYGVDEMFDGDALTLGELNSALAGTDLKRQKLEFIGFDACLMANLETAFISKKYADYLIASEELEPGQGWNYKAWMPQLAKKPDMNGAELGKIIAESFVDYYMNDEENETAVLSVTDLSKIDPAVSALEDLIKLANFDLSKGNYNIVAKPRSRSFEFGLPIDLGTRYDMIDIVSMAEQFESLYPKESAALKSAIENAVVFKAQTPYVTHAGGLSIYFPYSDKENLDSSIPTYKTTGFSPAYIQYVTKFSKKLAGERFILLDIAENKVTLENEDLTFQLTKEELEYIDTVKFSVWVYTDTGSYQIYEDSQVDISENGKVSTEFYDYITTIEGHYICLSEIDRGDNYIRLGSPGTLNGENVIFTILCDDDNPSGIVTGAVPSADGKRAMPSKQVLPVKKGDKITFFYFLNQFEEDDENEESEEEEEDSNWLESEEFTVTENKLRVETSIPDEGTFGYGFIVTDFQRNTYLTDFLEITY